MPDAARRSGGALLSLLYRLVVLESGLGLESGLKSIFAGLGLGLGLGGSASKSFFKFFVSTRSIAL